MFGHNRHTLFDNDGVPFMYADTRVLANDKFKEAV